MYVCIGLYLLSKYIHSYIHTTIHVDAVSLVNPIGSGVHHDRQRVFIHVYFFDEFCAHRSPVCVCVCVCTCWSLFVQLAPNIDIQKRIVQYYNKIVIAIHTDRYVNLKCTYKM